MCASNSGSSWSYDPMGRPILESRTNYGSVRQKYSVSYSYNKDGSLATITYPSTNVVTYTVGGAGRVTQVSDPANTYVTSPQGGGPMYAPGGQLVGMTSGSQIATSNAYNSRQQPIFLTAGTSGNTVLSRCYDFHSASAINSGQCQFNAYGSGNNGNVFQILDKVNSNNSAVFSYDLLNRITQANTISTTAPCWGENYTIDYWGNLTNIAGVTSMPSCMTETLSAAPATTLNQLTAYCYDAAGNMLQTGVCPTGSFTPTWAYDVENRLSSTAGYSYYYDADGARMEKSAGATGTMYWPGHGGEYLTEAAVNGTINAEYIYFAGKRLARMDQPNGQVHYYFSDHLASTSVITDTNSNIQSQYYYYPFGGSQSSSGSDPNHYKFTGKERDSESGLDMFGARYYFSSFGRFVTPDWAAAPTAVPYAAFGDPQSLNLYGYVRNNPLARRDVDGHDWWQKLKNWYGDPGCWCEGEEADKAAAVNRAKAQAQKAEDLRRWNIIMRDPAKAQMFMGLAMAGVGLGEGEAIISPGAEASPVGQGEESPTPQEGASDPLQSINTGKNIKNWETPSTPDQVGSNLESQGFTKGTASDGSIRYTKGNMEYTMYPKSQTTGGPSMQVKIDGTVVAKVRMQ
jgi:RHS repeat-associated protein